MNSRAGVRAEILRKFEYANFFARVIGWKVEIYIEPYK